jgi:hypothetical protein
MIRKGLGCYLWPRPVFVGDIIHLPCTTSENSILTSPCPTTAFRAFTGSGDGDWRLPRSRSGPRPATTFYPRRPFGRTRPIPYASVTLSGSYEEKRTHLYFGESNSCPGSGRSFPQSQRHVPVILPAILLSRLPCVSTTALCCEFTTGSACSGVCSASPPVRRR